jgi:hypothetical protein
MNTQNRRFIFIDFENLRKIKFKKLEKVATKIFIFINADVEKIPAFLVYQIQKLGKDVKWITVENPNNNRMNYHMAFLMGKLHQKLHSDVEFAVLSNDKDFDPLVGFINAQNRNCIRVKRKKTAEERKTRRDKTPLFTERKPEGINIRQDVPITNGLVNGLATNGSYETAVVTEKVTAPSAIEIEYDRMVIEKTAQETMDRLIRSGNRPAEVDTLKHYILLNNQELSIHGNIEQVIEQLESTNSIEIEEEGHVIYHF